MRLPSRVSCVAVLAASVLLAGCERVSKAPQAALGAKVNGDEITLDHVSFAAAQLAKGSAASTPETRRKALDQLINQQLLAQQAQSKGLQNDSQVQAALEVARRNVLARAYQEQLLRQAAKPDANAVQQYYSSNPALFAQRRLYRFNQLAIAATEDSGKAVEAKLQAMQTTTDRNHILGELVAWLQSQNIKFRAGTVTQTAEQLPLDLLPKFHAMKDGDIIAIPMQGGMGVMQLAASKDEPLEFDKAKAAIEERLLAREHEELTRKEFKRLREVAKIEYFAEFQSAEAPNSKDSGGLPDLNKKPDAEHGAGNDKAPTRAP